MNQFQKNKCVIFRKLLFFSKQCNFFYTVVHSLCRCQVKTSVVTPVFIFLSEATCGLLNFSDLSGLWMPFPPGFGDSKFSPNTHSWVCSFRESQCVTRREVFKLWNEGVWWDCPALYWSYLFFYSSHLFLSKQWFYKWDRNLREYRCGSSEPFRKISV